MRITCPTCDAHYEIGDDLIRPDGREVQCSNCGTTWFEEGRERPAAGEGGSRAGGKADDRDEGEGDGLDEDGEAGDVPASPAPPRRPAADKAALDILREERAREDRLRAGLRSGAEQAGPSGGVPGAPAVSARSPREAAAAERMRMAAAATRARARTGSRAEQQDDVLFVRKRPETRARADTGTGAEADGGNVDARARSVSSPAGDAAPPAAVPAAADVAAARRGRITRLALLPDIEEINSSLHSDERGGAESLRGDASERGAEPAARAGFRAGFIGICTLASALVAVYVFGEPIARSVPALSAPVTRYVAWVDDRRMEFEVAVEALTERITPEP